MKTIEVLNRINSYAEYEKKMNDYSEHIVKMMIGREGQPIPLHVMMVSGEKGVGKTYTAQKILENQSIRNFEIVNSSMSAVQLYKFLWDHNDAIIVLDDVNSILMDNKDGASLLKACTETVHKRKLNWLKSNPCCVPVRRFGLSDNSAIANKMDSMAMLDPKLEKKHIAGLTFPDSFYFTGALIILTNKPLSVIDRVTEGAVSNRGWHQEMLFSVDGAVDMIKHLAERLDEFNGQTLSKESVAIALDFLTNEHAIHYYKVNGKLPTIRTLGKVAQAVENGITLDEDVLNDYTECPAY